MRGMWIETHYIQWMVETHCIQWTVLYDFFVNNKTSCLIRNTSYVDVIFELFLQFWSNCGKICKSCWTFHSTVGKVIKKRLAIAVCWRMARYRGASCVLVYYCHYYQVLPCIRISGCHFWVYRGIIFDIATAKHNVFAPVAWGSKDDHYSRQPD